MKLRSGRPACGSGSFLIAAYQYLLDWHLAAYVVMKRRPKNTIYKGADGEWRLTLAERKRILLTNIFGVDIYAQAVEVAKLSLLLKVIEGVTQMAFAIERLLPDLGTNIVCGNSLIGTDFYGPAELIAVNPDEPQEAKRLRLAQGVSERRVSGRLRRRGRQPPMVDGWVLRRRLHGLLQQALRRMQGQGGPVLPVP